MAVCVALRSFDPAIAGVRRVTFADAVRDHQEEVFGAALRITTTGNQRSMSRARRS